MPANLENSEVATGLEKVSFHSNPKGNAKEGSNYCTIALISRASKVMLKILQARLQQYDEFSEQFPPIINILHLCIIFVIVDVLILIHCY